MNILVLGAGLIGAPMARDLAADREKNVTVADISDAALKNISAYDRIQPVQADLSDPKALLDIMTPADMVINAVPGHLGFSTLKRVIEAGKNVVDIAFFPEDPFPLDGLAKNKGVTAVVDCGVAPGMSNMLIGLGYSRLDRTDSATIYVGGLPEVRSWPYEYKAVFSPLDVIEEYVRPAVYRENGTMVTKPALSDAELIDFPGIGTLEAFNTDGVRSLYKTLAIPTIKEKTLRYPGHAEKIRLLRKSGFFDTKPVEIAGVRVRPMDLTAKLLFPMWQLKPDDVDFTLMRIIVQGEKAGQPLRYVWDLFDRRDPSTGVHSMARTTGYTATMVARLIAQKGFTENGIVPPERIGVDAASMNFILNGLAKRGVIYRESVEYV